MLFAKKINKKISKAERKRRKKNKMLWQKRWLRKAIREFGDKTQIGIQKILGNFFGKTLQISTYVRHRYGSLTADEGKLTRPELEETLFELLENRKKISRSLDMPWLQQGYYQKSLVELMMGVLLWNQEKADSKDPELFSRAVWLIQGVQELEAEISASNSVKYYPWDPLTVIEYHSPCAKSIQRGLEKARQYRK